MNKKNGITNFLKRIKTDYVFRTYLITSVALLITLVFAFYNFYLGIKFSTSWNISIAIYYAFLIIIKIGVIITEKQFYKSKVNTANKKTKNANIYFIQSIILFAVDLLLVVPISLLAMQKKEIDYSSITALIYATYTIFKVIMATKNFMTAKKYDNFSVQIIRQINLKDALIAILSLQYILIMTFGNGITGEMQILCAVSTFIIFTILITISVINLKNAIKVKKSK